jgi:hypothetical protein
MQKEATIFNFPRQMSKKYKIPAQAKKERHGAPVFVYMPSLSESAPQQRAAT